MANPDVIDLERCWEGPVTMPHCKHGAQFANHARAWARGRGITKELAGRWLYRRIRRFTDIAGEYPEEAWPTLSSYLSGQWYLLTDKELRAHLEARQHRPSTRPAPR